MQELKDVSQKLALLREQFREIRKEIDSQGPEIPKSFDGAPHEIDLLGQEAFVSGAILALEYAVGECNQKGRGKKMSDYKSLFESNDIRKPMQEKKNGREDVTEKMGEILSLMQLMTKTRQKLDVLMRDVGESLGIDYDKLSDKIKKGDLQ